MNPSRQLCAVLLFGLSCAGATWADELLSGPQLGKRPLPFTSNAVTGPNRGKQHCYVCEMKGETAVLIFSRQLDEATGLVLQQLRDAAQVHPRERFFGWMVVLGKESGTITAAAEADLEAQSYAFAKRYASASVPLSALGDTHGPPGYNIAPEAACTVIVFRSGKVLYNRAYTAKQWTPAAARAALRDLPRLIERPAAAPPSPAPAGA